jgi:uncharacterized protein YdhG (YjbR/CyaY superfamily)
MVENMTKTTDTTSAAPAFTAEELAAMKERSKEVKGARRGKATREEDTQDVLDKIAALPEHDRRLAERIHAIVTETVPDVWPKTWYGQPAYAVGGKTFCFFQPSSKFKTRYSTLGFNDPAQLDDGTMWPVAFAIVDLTAEDEERVRQLVQKAAG